MKLDIRSLAIAFAASAGILFTLCSIAVAAAPDVTIEFVRHALHLDLGPVTRPVTVGGFVEGLLFVGACSALGGGLVALIYNRIRRINARTEGSAAP